MRRWLILFLYFSILTVLTVFSWTQIDPHPWFGFLPGFIFVGVVALLSICYFYFIKHPPKQICIITLLSTIILFSGHPAALSRDVYNYAIYAKTLVVYHQNPWTTPPKSHPNDPLLPNINWPNDSSRYGPVWIFPSTLLYSVWPSLWAFKFLTTACYLVSLFLVQKMGGRNAVTFLVFNPLMIIEYFLGTHTDIVMTFFILLSIFTLSAKRFPLSWLSFLLSIGTKITSLPVGATLWLSQTFHLNQKILILLSIWFAYLGSLIIIAKWSINPWYFTLPIILTGLLLESKFHKYLAISLSIAVIIRYAPLIFLGWFNPNNKIRAELFLLFMLPFAVWTLKAGLANIRKQVAKLEAKATSK